MSDFSPRPRIRPATSDDWQKDQSDRASPTPAQGQESNQSAADFDDSTYYEYLEKHTGDVPVSTARSRNVFAPAGSAPFQGQSQGAHAAPSPPSSRGQTNGMPSRSAQAD
ncbi:MAG: protein kinase, partial [Brevibacterium sp.]|nr:protein kinase [Brevibacterium sp.]